MNRTSLGRAKSSLSFIALMLFALALASHAIIADGPITVLILDSLLSVFIAFLAGVSWARKHSSSRPEQPPNSDS